MTFQESRSTNYNHSFLISIDQFNQTLGNGKTERLCLGGREDDSLENFQRIIRKLPDHFLQQKLHNEEEFEIMLPLFWYADQVLTKNHLLEYDVDFIKLSSEKDDISDSHIPFQAHIIIPKYSTMGDLLFAMNRLLTNFHECLFFRQLKLHKLPTNNSRAVFLVDAER